jgi:hypothetical protein
MRKPLIHHGNRKKPLYPPRQDRIVTDGLERRLYPLSGFEEAQIRLEAVSGTLKEVLGKAGIVSAFYYPRYALYHHHGHTYAVPTLDHEADIIEVLQ